MDRPTTLSSESQFNTNIHSLCEEMLLHVLKYVPNDDLLNLSQVSQMFNRITMDKSLWVNVYLNSYKPSWDSIYLKYINNMTTHITIRSKYVSYCNSTISRNFLRSLKTLCPNLTAFGLFDIEVQYFKTKYLHPGLTALRIVDTGIFQTRIMSIWTDLNVFCPNIQTLDLRLTVVSNIDIPCFQKLKNLRHIFLESHPYDDNQRTLQNCDFMKLFYIDISEYLFDSFPGNDYDSKIETLHVRHYKNINDDFLYFVVKYCPSLKLLDVTGTGCTLEKIQACELKKPDLKIIFHS